MDDLYLAPETINRLRVAATAFLENLRPDQRARAMFDLGDATRSDWDFIPKQGRLGLPLKEMDARQQTLAHMLLAAGLSLPAYAKVISIMNLEHLLRELNKERLGHWAADFRNAQQYFFSFFGRPNFEESWGWRVVGHHVSLNFTIINDRYLAPTPCLLGAEPAHYGSLRPLAEDEDRGFELLYALGDDLRSRAVIHDVAPADLVTRQVPRLGAIELPDEYEVGLLHYRISDDDREVLKYIRSEPRGVAGSAMSQEQRARFSALIECYLERLPVDVTATHQQRLGDGGLDQFFFCWAGKQVSGQPHYYRVQGPSFLVEFENVHLNANHIHSVWRDPDNDFGEDLLARHWQSHHSDGLLPIRLSRITSSSLSR